MIAPDSSVLVAGSETGHRHHEVATDVLARVQGEGALVAHTLSETYSTLTGPAYAQHPGNVRDYLAQFRDRPVVAISARDQWEALEELASAGITGGSIYDGLIGFAARQGGLTLVSLDRRARTAYERLGVDFELLG